MAARFTRPTTLLWTAIAAFAVGLSALAALRHAAFKTGRFDLGNMVQAVWSTAHGAPLEATSLGGEQFVRLGAHFDPLLVAFAPLWWLWPSPSLLLVAQAAVTALGALPLFWLARKHLESERAALGFALAYLLVPALHWQTLSDFHAVALATPLLLFAIWYLDEERLAPFAVFALLAATSKEHVGLVVAALGIWYAVAHRRVTQGAAIAVAGAAVSVMAVALVIPHFSPAGESSFYGRYDAVGGSAGGIAQTAVSDPATIATAVTERRDLAYLFQLFAPLLALPLLAPLLLVAAVPELLLNLLSSTRTQTSIHFHYSAATLAVAPVAAVFGARRLLAWRRVRPPTLAAAVVAAAVAATYVLGALPVWGKLPGGEDLNERAFSVGAHARAAAEGVELVPPRSVVAASNALGAHLSDRRRFLSFPFLRDARWVAVDERDPRGYADRHAPRLYADAIRRLRRDERWRLVYERDGVLVFRRR